MDRIQRTWWRIFDILIVLFVSAAALGILFGAISLFYVNIDGAGCAEIERTAQVNTEWRFWNGCYVESNGKLIPKDRWMRIEGSLNG